MKCLHIVIRVVIDQYFTCMEFTYEQKQQLIERLGSTLSEERRCKIHAVACQRTFHLAMVLEDIYQPHNASAVLRSCDCFGVQRVHAIEKRNTFTKNPNISLGAEKWIDFQRWRDTTACLSAVKQEGYQLVALTLSEKAVPLSEVSVERPMALCIGTEETGLSVEAHTLVDVHAFMPMYGFTQSFNLSVCAALCLQTVTQRLHESGVHYRLSTNESIDLELRWLLEDIGYSWKIVVEFCKSHNLPVPSELLKK